MDGINLINKENLQKKIRKEILSQIEMLKNAEDTLIEREVSAVLSSLNDTKYKTSIITNNIVTYNNQKIELSCAAKISVPITNHELLMDTSLSSELIERLQKTTGYENIRIDFFRKEINFYITVE